METLFCEAYACTGKRKSWNKQKKFKSLPFSVSATVKNPANKNVVVFKILEAIYQPVHKHVVKWKQLPLLSTIWRTWTPEYCLLLFSFRLSSMLFL